MTRAVSPYVRKEILGSPQFYNGHRHPTSMDLRSHHRAFRPLRGLGDVDLRTSVARAANLPNGSPLARGWTIGRQKILSRDAVLKASSL